MSNCYIEYNDKMAFHPGYYIKEVIDDMGITQEDFAKRLDTTPKNLSLLIRGEQSLSIDIATKLSRMLDTSIIYWLNLQNEFDALKAESISDKMLEEEKNIYNIMDYSYFKTNYNLPVSDKDVELSVTLIRRFLKLSSLTLLDKDNLSVCFRSKSELLSKEDRIKANTMVQIATNEVLSVDAPKYNKALFTNAIDYALKQTVNNDFYEDVREAFYQAGVILVVIPNFANSNTSGASKKVGDSVMLMVNDRKNYSDYFWFTMFHEIGHIMLGDFGISMDKEEGKKESEANDFARNMLIPNDIYQEFVSRGEFGLQDIKNFADEINRHPGIVAGRLIHDKIIKENEEVNSLRKRFKIYRHEI